MNRQHATAVPSRRISPNHATSVATPGINLQHATAISLIKA
jgi:hypothetical protein